MFSTLVHSPTTYNAQKLKDKHLNESFDLDEEIDTLSAFFRRRKYQNMFNYLKKNLIELNQIKFLIINFFIFIK
jgi:hypothetical protein